MVLINWYSQLFLRVKWGNHVSEEFHICCGIRQSGVISPVLFNIYVDNILNSLTKYGCKIGNVSYGSFLYADDLILLSPSVYELKIMLSICEKELENLDLCFNTDKSCCMRFGKQFYLKCGNLSTSKGDLKWVEQYLGLTFTSGKRISVSLTEFKSKFYYSFNEIYSKIGNIVNIYVIINLLETIAVPMLTYALEAIVLNKQGINSLNFTLSAKSSK